MEQDEQQGMAITDEGTNAQSPQPEVTAKVNSAELLSDWEQKVERAREIEVRVHIGARTDLGRVRENNEDKYEFYVPEDPEILALKGSLYAVADGMGGHSAGQIASEVALKTAIEYYYSDESPLIEESLRAALKQANGMVFDLSRSIPDRQGMGTTSTILVIRGDEAYIAQVGDSRCYRVRGSKIEQISEDHSWVNEQVKLGALTHDQAMMSPFKNIITRSIGNAPNVDVDIFSIQIEEGDIFILCSDGLSNEVTDNEIRDAVNNNTSPSTAAWNLVDKALEHGGRDNTTILIAAVRELIKDKVPRKKGFFSFLSGG